MRIGRFAVHNLSSMSGLQPNIRCLALFIFTFSSLVLTLGVARAAPVVSFDYEFVIGSDTLSNITHPNLNFAGTVMFDLATLDGVPGGIGLGSYSLDSHLIDLNGTALTGGVTNVMGSTINNIDVYFQSYYGSSDFVYVDSTLNTTIGIENAQLWQISLRFNGANPNFTSDSLFLPDPSNFASLQAVLFYTDPDSSESKSLGTSFRITQLSYGTTETPVPAALPLFASGLGVMGFLGWRRRRKKAIAMAPV
jgi:hypothetical protein